MAEQENEEQKQPEKSNGIKQIVIIASTIVATVLAIASAFFITQKMNEPKNAPDKPVVDEAKKKATYYKLKEFTVNLSSEGQYLETEMVLELDNEEVKNEINNKMPRVRDEILSILMSKTGGSLISLQGKEALKNDIKTKLNTILTSGKVSTIHFTSFLMQ